MVTFCHSPRFIPGITSFKYVFVSSTLVSSGWTAYIFCRGPSDAEYCGLRILAVVLDGDINDDNGISSGVGTNGGSPTYEKNNK